MTSIQIKSRRAEDIDAKLELLKRSPTREQALKQFEGYMQGLSSRDQKRFDEALKALPRAHRRH